MLLTGGTDKDGWQYAKDFPASYHPDPGFTDYVRRRRWSRRCHLHTTGPWSRVGSTRLLDIALSAPDQAGGVQCWAVATTGEALVRLGVTPEQPGGEAWSHVRSDVLFQSVSVGVDGRVWLVSGEGSVFWRQGVTSSCVTGQAWIQVSNGEHSVRFRSVEAGRAGLLAVSTDHRLWLRTGVSAQCPEGVSWSVVSEDVRSVSTGDNGDIWAVLDTGSGGVVVRRSGVTPSNPGDHQI